MNHRIVAGIILVLLAGCGTDSVTTTVTTPTTSATTAAPTTSTTLPPTTVIAPTEGFPEAYPPELVPPGVTSVYWEPTGAGTDVFMESTSGFEDLVDFFADALEPPLDVSTDGGVNRAIWVYKPGIEHIAVIVESDTGDTRIKVSGLF